MRIACVHVPQFALQSLGRIDPSLRGAPVAVVGAGSEPAPGARPSLALHSPVVLACSRAAWNFGVRLGMTASAARFVSSEVRVVAADAQLERETVRAIADGLLGVSSVVDTGGRVAAGGAHLAMYCEVPSKTRGSTFGDRLLDLLDTLGLAARIGIADDRFTAWVAAAQGGAVDGARDVTIVPRGGSAAFLAPRPLSLLAITPEVLHMLEALGVRTLGEFAALPAPSVARPIEADYQALARGDGGGPLRPYAPEAPIREQLAVGGGGSLFEGAAAFAALAERVAIRLRGRARGASRLEVTIADSAGERTIPVIAEEAVASQDALVALTAPLVGEVSESNARIAIAVIGEAVSGEAVAADAAARAFAAANSSSLLASAALRAAAHVTTARAAEPTARLAAGGGHPHALRGQRAALEQIAGLEEIADPSVGHGPLWQLSTPQALRSERRDAHRRTRRARPRRRMAAIAQPALFGTTGGASGGITGASGSGSW